MKTKSVTFKIPTVLTPTSASRVVRTVHQALLTVLVTFVPLVAYFGVPAGTVATASAALVAVLAAISKVYQTLFPAAPALATEPLDMSEWGAPAPVVVVAPPAVFSAPPVPVEPVPAVEPVADAPEPVAAPDPTVAVLPGGAVEVVSPPEAGPLESAPPAL